MIKGSIQDDIIVNIYAPNTEEPQYYMANANNHKNKNWH